MVNTIKRYNQPLAAAYFTPSDLGSKKSLLVINPTNAEDRTIFFTDAQITIGEMQAVLVGSASPSVTWTVRYASDRSAAGTEVVTGGTATTSTTSGSAITTFNSATIPADNWVWLETTAKANTVTELSVTVKFGAPVVGGGSNPDYEAIEWTTFTQNGGDRIIYVSDSTGNDSNDGTIGTPYKTIAKGLADMRTGHADWMLLKKGDTFTNQRLVTGGGSYWRLSGADSSHRMLVGSYGTGAPPKIDSQATSAISFNDTDWPTHYAHVAFVGLELYSSTYTGSADRVGIIMFGENDDILFEDCYIHDWSHGFVLQGASGAGNPVVWHTNITVRGCRIVNCYTEVSGHRAQGCYVEHVINPTLEWNTLYHCGFNATSYATDFEQAIYTHEDCPGTIIKYNIVSGGASVQARYGGVVTGNVLSRMPVGLNVGNANAAVVGGITATVDNNIILEGLDPSNMTGYTAVFGLTIGNMVGGYIRGNIVGPTDGTATNYYGMWFQIAGDGHSAAYVLQNTVVSGNIVHDFGGVGVQFDGTSSYYVNNQWANNVFQNPNNTVLSGTGIVVSLTDGALTSSDLASSSNHYVQHPGASGGSGVVVNVAGTPTSLATWLLAISDIGSNGTVTTYADTARTLGTYYLSLGGSNSHDDFMAYVIATQTRDTWDNHLTAAAVVFYVKAGFV